MGHRWAWTLSTVSMALGQMPNAINLVKEKVKVTHKVVPPTSPGPVVLYLWQPVWQNHVMAETYLSKGDWDTEKKEDRSIKKTFPVFQLSSTRLFL